MFLGPTDRKGNSWIWLIILAVLVGAVFLLCL